MGVFVGALAADLVLGDVASRKHKRAVVRPLVAGLRRLEVAVAETGHHDLLQRTEIGVSVVSGEHAQVGRLLDAVERWLWSRPEIEVVSTRRWVRSIADD
jgi:uncharacterized protein YlxP (DUF503 family)